MRHRCDSCASEDLTPKPLVIPARSGDFWAVRNELDRRLTTASPTGRADRALSRGVVTGDQGQTSKLAPLFGSIGRPISVVAASIESRNALRSSSLPGSARRTLKFALPALVWNRHRRSVNRSASVAAWPWWRYGAPSDSPYSDGTL